MRDDLLIDTWGWLVLHNKREPRYAEINAFYRRLRMDGGSIYTTDYILDETLTMLFRRLPFSLARRSTSLLDKAVEQGYLKLEWISPARFEAAKGLRLRLHDKPGISFTDLTSMVVMRELDLSSILTDDDHFLQVGMGFRKMP